MEGGDHVHVHDHDHEEIRNFIKVWLTVTISLCYCYAIGKLISKGVKRLIFVIPIVCLFLYLPLLLYSSHLGGTTAFFIGWLANFKLLLFAFGLGPLCSDPSISLPLFVAVSCLPIKITNPSHQNDQNKNKHNNQSQENKKPKQSPLNYAIKGLTLAVLVHVYDYSDYLHPTLILLLYAFHIYFILELILAVSAYLARSVLGLELEPQFNEPFLASSLQDFWGKRWNLMVTSILRPTVYKPTFSAFACAVGSSWAALPAIFATFLVSGLMHELVFYYLGRVKPTGEVTVFFLLHGVCLMVEIAMKKAVNGKWRLPKLISGPLTVFFVMATGLWLFFPQFVKLKIDVRAFEEYAALGAFLKNVSQRIFGV
ncbi:hypothetical protein Dsin_010750 [Dipteronia sinensis]|uniref:Wax synthase domain-containing protein n=1 Tax=Dipteronia sinensis TaxID=43782 RepID=A0AAE0AU32_9ROSI|nr:hypothetical protein Dsin_010750 [Dipteronia sinensis]